MQIIKVIVDELPEACINCGWANNKTCWLNKAEPLTDMNMYSERPDWCPLVLKSLYDMEIIQNFVGKESEE